MDKKIILTIAFLGFLAISSQASALSIAYEPEAVCPIEMENRQDCVKKYDDGIEKTIAEWDKQLEIQNLLDNGDIPFEVFEQDGQGNPINGFETPQLKVVQKSGWFSSLINFLFGWL